MESIALQLPLYTAASTACLMLIQVALMFSVIKSRGDLNIFIGHGDNAMLERKIRAHGNFVEYAPLGLVLIAVAELQGAPAFAVHLLGTALFLGRALHAYGITRPKDLHPARGLGMLLTFAALGLTSLALLAHRLF